MRVLLGWSSSSAKRGSAGAIHLLLFLAYIMLIFD